MDLIQLIAVIAIIGFIVWLVVTYVPDAASVQDRHHADVDMRQVEQ